MGATAAALNQAQIVISTQEALRRTLRTTADFNDAARYHYRGQRRAVVCWDEALAFNRPVTLASAAVTNLASVMARQSAEGQRELLLWGASLVGAKTGACVVPTSRR